MPRTVNLLLHGFDAVEFRKLNKVGSNSRPNGFVLLFGKTTEPIEKTVMKLETIKADLNYHDLCRTYLDDLPYIPHEYYEAGYMTADVQDYKASVLHYPNCMGMKKKTANHYFRPFYVRIRKDEDLYRIHRTRRCRESTNDMLEYHSMFLHSYPKFPKFSFMWLTELAHSNAKRLYKFDYDLYNYFLSNRKSLSKSFLFFVADHGPRLGQEARAAANREERKNPFLYIVLPQHLRGSPMHEQLKANSKELLTHHDIHTTLKDILYVEFESLHSFSP